ncbi:MAG TPA: carboxypeptidase regulatory-like domain-containing protein [Gemmatimonadaceae bacterium]|nr:carboxypeptidase regulatory-like domain-containing protein [Gemmatimonadaceae bacterium]
MTLYPSSGWMGRASALGGLLLALAAPAARAAAQTTTGNVRGFVTAAAGSPVADAQIAARDLQTNQIRGTTTTASGSFYLGGLRPSRYEVTVRRVGFGPQSRPAQVLIGQTIDVNFALTETTIALEAVQVIGQAATTETRTSEIATNITQAQIENLPTFERNVLDLAKLAPGTTASAVNSSDKTFSAAGQPPEAVNIFVDGASYKSDVLRGGVAGQDASKGNPFPQGAIQEFRVITQNFKAEYQKAGGAIITATTRTGSNQWEGDAFLYNVSKAYVARDAYTRNQGGSRPNYDRIQAGASAGGPLLRDKLFFFGTYELNRRDEPAYVRFRPTIADLTAAQRSFLETNFSSYLGQHTQEFREHLGFAKLTWLQSERSTFDLSTNLRTDKDFRGFGGETAFEAAENVAIDVYNAVGNWRFAGDRWLNELQVNGQHYVWNPTWVNPDVIGRRYVDLRGDNIIRIGGKDSQQQFTQNRVSFRNDLTRSGVQLAGDHVFKGGASLDFLTYEARKEFNLNPVFRYSPANSYAHPDEANFGFGDSDVDTDNTQFGAYIQDDWSIGRRLVLNLGLRWDIETNMINNDYVTPGPLADSLRNLTQAQRTVLQPTGPNATGGCCTFASHDVFNELGGVERYITSGSSDRPAYKNAWQPRVGASYDLFGTGRTVLFGGFGVYYDRNYWNTMLDEQFRRQFAVLTVRFVGPTAPIPAGCFNCAQWNDRYFDPAQLRTLAGSTGLPEVFLNANDMKPPRTHQFNVGVRQTMGNLNVRISYNGVRGFNYMNFVRASPFGGGGTPYSTIFIADDRVKTWYDALQLQIERPLREGTRWGGSLAYTLGRSEEQGQSADIFWGFDDRYPTVGDRPRLRAPGDQRHAISINGVALLPWDLRFSTIMSFGTGIIENATNNTAGTEPFQSSKYPYEPPGRPFLGIGHVFSTQSVDLRLERDFWLATGQRLGLVADLFNAFNIANYGCYSSTIGVGGTPATNRPGCAGLGRRFQVGLRYGFRPDRMEGTGGR